MRRYAGSIGRTAQGMFELFFRGGGFEVVDGEIGGRALKKKKGNFIPLHTRKRQDCKMWTQSKIDGSTSR